MTKQKNLINTHAKEIKQMKDDVKEILGAVGDVEVQVDEIKDNE